MTTYCDNCNSHPEDTFNKTYHDTQYGFPLKDDNLLFERLILEINQAGLSWITILRKRENYRKAFDGFDPARIAGYGERDVDRLILDLPEPWQAIGPTTESLAPGGILCCYLPTVPQVQQTVEAMRGAGFALINTFEGLVRTWNVDGQSVRPDHRMVAHTGFLITGRKTTTSQVPSR